MNKINFVISILCLITLISCNRTDFSNPEEVIKSYRALSNGNKNKKLYEDFLSSKSKEFATGDEFIKTRNIPDSILNSITIIENKISSYPIDVNNPTYRRFKVDLKRISQKDTLNLRLYYTLINENGEWKVIWTGTLSSFADKMYNDGNYSEARKTLEKAIEINPFNGEAYQQLAWCYYRDNSLPRDEWEEGVVKNAKYAVFLEEDNPEHYNTLAAYYANSGNTDLAIKNCERGLSYCQNSKDKVLFYSNLAGNYANNEEYEKAEEFIKKSIEIYDKDSFAWFKYGRIMQDQGRIDRAMEYFEKALKMEKMENSLQGMLFSSYSICCLEKGKCDDAKDYVMKALDIEPNNDSYQALYNKIKHCSAKSI